MENYFNITNEMIASFLNGLVFVLLLVLVGSILALILAWMAKRFPFTRIALVITLSPLAFIRLLELADYEFIQKYAMLTTLAGFLIDGIHHLIRTYLPPRAETSPAAEVEGQDSSNQEAEQSADSPKDSIVWEKAE